MTLEALRQEVGSHDFFVILRGGHSRTNTGMSPHVNSSPCPSAYRDKDLDAFFKAWLVYGGETCAQLVRKLLGDDLRRGTQRSERVHRGIPGR